MPGGSIKYLYRNPSKSNIDTWRWNVRKRWVVYKKTGKEQPGVKGRGNRRNTCNKVSGLHFMIQIIALNVTGLNTPIKWQRPTLNIMKMKWVILFYPKKARVTAYTWEKVNVGQNECNPTYFWNGHFERCVLYGVPQALSISHVSSQKSKVSTHSCEFWESWQRPWYNLGTKGKLRSSLGEQTWLAFSLSGNTKRLSDEGIADSGQMWLPSACIWQAFPSASSNPVSPPSSLWCRFLNLLISNAPILLHYNILVTEGIGQRVLCIPLPLSCIPNPLGHFWDAIAKASHELALCCRSFQVDEIADTHHQVWLQRSLSLLFQLPRLLFLQLPI